MSNKETVRINFDFPQEEYPYFKAICARNRVSIREMLTQYMLKVIEEYEDDQLYKICEEQNKNRKDENVIDWEEAKKLAGWE